METSKLKWLKFSQLRELPAKGFQPSKSTTIFGTIHGTVFGDYRDPTRGGSDSSGILCLIRPLLEG